MSSGHFSKPSQKILLPEVRVKSPQIVRREEVHHNPFEIVNRVQAKFDGFTKDYYVVDFGPRVGIVAVQNGKLLLTAQYRFLIDGIAWEIPGGGLDPGESSEQAAQRECLEETGFFCVHPKPLVSYRPGLDNVENLTTIFYSEQVVRRNPFTPDPSEVLALAWLPIEDCISLVFEGSISDCFTISALLAYNCLVRKQ